MKILLTVFLIFPSLCFAWTGECVGISDGDTITVMHGETAEKIRLHGIDCPEKRQPFGRRAKQFTSAMVFRQMANVEPLTKDRYGRTIAWVSVDRKSLNKELVRAGLAWWFRKYVPHDTDLERLEQEARADRRGLWVDPSPVPPWEFRRTNKK